MELTVAFSVVLSFLLCLPLYQKNNNYLTVSSLEMWLDKLNQNIFITGIFRLVSIPIAWFFLIQISAITKNMLFPVYGQVYFVILIGILVLYISNIFIQKYILNSISYYSKHLKSIFFNYLIYIIVFIVEVNVANLFFTFSKTIFLDNLILILSSIIGLLSTYSNKTNKTFNIYSFLVFLNILAFYMASSFLLQEIESVDIIILIKLAQAVNFILYGSWLKRREAYTKKY